MKKYALYPGCVMPTEQYAYELSIRETFPLLDIELIDLEGFSCCGEPMKSVNQLMTLYLSARNLAIGEKHDLDLFVQFRIDFDSLKVVRSGKKCLSEEFVKTILYRIRGEAMDLLSSMNT